MAQLHGRERLDAPLSTALLTPLPPPRSPTAASSSAPGYSASALASSRSTRTTTASEETSQKPAAVQVRPLDRPSLSLAPD